MVISDFNIICLNQKNEEFFDTTAIKYNTYNLNIKDPDVYVNWDILKSFKGIWYYIYPSTWDDEVYTNDKEFFDLHYENKVYCDVVDAFRNKKNQLSCIKDTKETIVKLIEFYLDKSPIKRICFICRVQDEEIEAILGTLSKKEFLHKLGNGQLKYNIAYIVSE